MRGIQLPTLDHTFNPILCDFGEVRFGEKEYAGIIQPQQYRAPEVLLEIPWSFKVDIWNVGTYVCSCECEECKTRPLTRDHKLGLALA